MISVIRCLRRRRRFIKALPFFIPALICLADSYFSSFKDASSDATSTVAISLDIADLPEDEVALNSALNANSVFNRLRDCPKADIGKFVDDDVNDDDRYPYHRLLLQLLVRCQKPRSPSLKLILLREPLVELAHSREGVVSTKEFLEAARHLSIFSDQLSTFVDEILDWERKARRSWFEMKVEADEERVDEAKTERKEHIVDDSIENGSDRNDKKLKIRVKRKRHVVVRLKVVDSIGGKINSILLQNESTFHQFSLLELDQQPISSCSKIIVGLSIVIGDKNDDEDDDTDDDEYSIEVSVLYWRPRHGLANYYEGYYFLPWSWKERSLAFPRLDFAPVCVEGWSGDLLWMPRNVSAYLWASEAAEFVVCDQKRNAEFAEKSKERTQLDFDQDGKRIVKEMTLLTSKKVAKARYVWLGIVSLKTGKDLDLCLGFW